MSDIENKLETGDGSDASACSPSFDHEGYLKSKSDGEILEMLKKVEVDLNEAAEIRNNSEDHEACFAACVLIAQEATARSLF